MHLVIDRGFNPVGLVLLMTVAPLCAGSGPVRPEFTLAENNGFCSGGSFKDAPVPTFGSFCDKGDANVGQAATGTFQLTGRFEIYLSGYPNSAGLGLRLENLTDHQSLDIRPGFSPGTDWRKFEFDIPSSWRGRDLRIVASDQLTGSMGWLAFGSPQILDGRQSRREKTNEAKKILLKTPLFALLLFLPGFALGAFAISRGIRGTATLGLVILAGIALPGYLLFFAYVLSPQVGQLLSRAQSYVAGLCLLVLLFRLAPADRRLLKVFLIPSALTLFASMAVLSMGYSYGGIEMPATTAQSRFSHPLPPDNTLPYLFAEYLKKGPVPKPMEGDWLSSDRPPLQTGMVLALESWTNGQAFWYQVEGAIIQSLWIFAVWLLLRVLGTGKLTAAVILATISFSGFAIVNTFYVWPKLLAATYTIAFAIPILATDPNRQHKWLLRWLMAFLLSSSLLAHGGAVFALLGLVPLVVLRFHKNLWAMLKEAGMIGAITALLYSPWIGYQKFIDPPGDRLLKFHLAGVDQVTSEPASRTIYAAYSKQTFGQWWASKRVNTETVFGHEMEYLRELPKIASETSNRQVRVLEFFYFLPSLGLAGLGAVCVLFRSKERRTDSGAGNERKAAAQMLLWAFASTVPWIILMFKPGSTVVHQGSYATVIVAMVGSILALRAVAPRLAIAVCVVQSTLHWAIYSADLTRTVSSPSLPASTNHWMTALYAVSLAVFFAMLAALLNSGKTEGATR